MRPVLVAMVEVSVPWNVQGGMSTIKTGQLLMLSFYRSHLPRCHKVTGWFKRRARSSSHIFLCNRSEEDMIIANGQQFQYSVIANTR